MFEVQGVGEEVVLAAIVFLVSTAGLAFLVFHVFTPTYEKATPKAAVVHAKTRPRHANSTCPICLTDVRLACETNCGHGFCTPCLTSYFASRRLDYPCPYCRQYIHLVHTFYSPVEISSQEGLSALRKLDTFNVRAGQKISLLQQLTDLPTLLNWARRPRRQSTLELWTPMRVMYCIVTLLYLISPVDMMPEMVFGVLGYLDDLLLILVILLGIARAIRQDIFIQASARVQREVPRATANPHQS
ncbi:hypothetical protein H310_06527 [Aphanomyces invadans]|uniref:E3 ubiquitin-protein ligase RNF170 n=1 Tax=Aphanomyces invadans TaxID=157072 RepID=A0A024U6W6_9STRA|nr:hypothetical protein H310_06527 [Aphanomyces invadans]ETW02009.1 hypothetical protein H310_06527 [Aphanomyces invadans]|eukprot:XP_008869857.1 hypothetical protein H310_06527 [Aphanomyces invadans]